MFDWRKKLWTILMALACSLICVSAATAQNEKDKPETPAEPTAKPKSEGDKKDQSTAVPLPKRDEMFRNLPTKGDLLTKPPADWVVLKNDDVLVVKPVQPRPNTMVTMKARREEFLKAPSPKKLPGESAEDYAARVRQANEEKTKQLAKLETIAINLPDSTKLAEEEDSDGFTINVEKFVKEIIHHEDLMLLATDRLLDKKELEDAYELLLVQNRTSAGWPGYDERFNRLLLVDAQVKFAAGEKEQAYSLLEQMHGRVMESINSKDQTKRYPTMGDDRIKCQKELGRITDSLIEPTVAARDFRQARFHLARLLKLEADHPDGARWKERLTSETNQILALATQAAAANKHDQAALLADEAALIWPATPNLKTQHRQFGVRWQTLKVGVVTVPPNDYPFETEAIRRRERLVRLPLFDPIRIDGGAKYRSRYLEGWEPTDLGRQAVFTLRTNRSPSETHPIVTASGAVSSLLERLRPESPHFDERLASFVDGVEVRGPFEFGVKFSRIPVRTEALFAMPLGFDEASSAELDQRYRIHMKTDRATTFRRVVPESDRTLQRHLAELTELTYQTQEKAVQGLLRGEVSMLPNFPVWLLDNLQKDGRFFVRKYSVPQTHFLQFNPQSKALRVSELRRAMMYSLDRSLVLREVVLHDLTLRTISETVPKANVPAKMPSPESGLTYNDRKLELVWSGLSMTDTQLRSFQNLSRDSEWRKAVVTLYSRSQPDRGRVVSAPWSTKLAAYNSVVAPREADPYLAFALSVAAKKSLGGTLPKLRLICEPDQICLAAAQRLVDEWKRIDIPVELITQGATPAGENQVAGASGQDVLVAQNDAAGQAQPAVNEEGSEPVAWDIAYRTMRMTEPMLELWPLLSLDKVARLETVKYLPDWLRQGLINLDRTADWPTTTATLQEMHRQIAETVQLIPLWEIDDAMVFRQTVRGIPDVPLHPYQDVDSWITAPWYPTD